MSEIDIEKIVKSCDHTLLKPEATWEQIRELCDDGARYGTASVCIPPCYAKQAVEYLDGRLPVCVVIGFPNGNSTTASKVFEAKEAIDNGVSEVDMVINIGWLKDRKYQEIENEIREIKAAVGSHVLKVIIETCLLSDEEKIRMCEIVTAAGADYIKTSTGFNAGGATFADVELMAQHVGPGVKVKAAGGIASLEDAQKFLDLGASRLGTSRIIKILKAQSI
ncbi:deoxyribose-phosphate aldolase [Lachnospiraceae bacterium NK3A20]|nr:deoxyribose-phosphate aldolase [Lachnospiraceae bacterium NK3A20]